MEEPRVDHETSVENLENKPNNGEDLTSAFATAEIPPDVSDTPQHETHINDPEDTIAEHSESSTSSSRRQSEVEGYLQIEDGQTGAKSASSRSSLSSIPDSVLMHPKEQSVYGRDSIGEIYEEQGQEFTSYGNPVYQKIHDRNSPFRHPSSVKAIQMQTEDEEDEEVMSPSRRKAAMFRGSPASVRSLGSPLLRRHGYHSAGNTPKRSSPIKRENPLVLLHCTVLQPTVVLGPGISLPDRQILERVLPPQYARRWKLLEEKISGPGLLRDRGLLIQHPQEDYGLLEERLLESLELQKPRLENGHYNNHAASDSENESGEEKSEHQASDDKGACVDCGCHVNHRDDRRKWDVKFYAANGLMKEGAWTAAWKEIERVDVQISLWLPYEVKCEVEKKIKEEFAVAAEMEKMKAAELIVNEPQPNRQNIISQDEIDGLDDRHNTTKSLPRQETRRIEREIPAHERPRTNKRKADPDLHTLIISSIRVLASDKRNIITIISMLIAVLAVVFGGRATKRSQYAYDMVQFRDFPAVSTQVYHTSSTSSVLTQSATEVPICESESCVERVSEVQRVVEGVLGDEKPKIVVQPVEPRHEEEKVIQPVEQKTIDIPADPKVEAITTAVPDAVNSAPIIGPLGSDNEPLRETQGDHTDPEKESFNAQEDDNTTTKEPYSAGIQSDDATIKSNEGPDIAQDHGHVAFHDADAAINPAEDITRINDRATPQKSDAPATRDDNAAISQNEDPAVTQENDSTATEDDEAAIPKTKRSVIAENDLVTAQDKPATVPKDDAISDAQIEDHVIINDKHITAPNDHPIAVQDDNHAIAEDGFSTPQLDISESAE
ncbi:hypothetical protein DPV78_010730 [Talaromyces pinophilus]|nr:hypothetical protein DPV78_010730 [Talaromyces pinophilus]